MREVFQDFLFALKCKCPVCETGDLFESRWSFVPKEHCDHCGTHLRDQDVGDGAIVLLIFVLGFTLVPAALIWEVVSAPPVWLQGLVWTAVGMATIFWLTPAIKAYIMLLQYRHRKADWK
ncbi:MAG: DUF983 domain-containing protein [Pseudomonadota bacterium]